jgi:hypothetical protein
MRPILVVNPADDDVFRVFAHVLLEDGVAGIGELERRLRSVYARAVVHARELSCEPFVIWYVYREGHWIGARRVDLQPGGQPDDVKSAR